LVDCAKHEWRENGGHNELAGFFFCAGTTAVAREKKNADNNQPGEIWVLQERQQMKRRF